MVKRLGNEVCCYTILLHVILIPFVFHQNPLIFLPSWGWGCSWLILQAKSVDYEKNNLSVLFLLVPYSYGLLSLEMLSYVHDCVLHHHPFKLASILFIFSLQLHFPGLPFLPAHIYPSPL